MPPGTVCRRCVDNDNITKLCPSDQLNDCSLDLLQQRQCPSLFTTAAPLNRNVLGNKSANGPSSHCPHNILNSSPELSTQPATTNAPPQLSKLNHSRTNHHALPLSKRLSYKVYNYRKSELTQNDEVKSGYEESNEDMEKRSGIKLLFRSLYPSIMSISKKRHNNWRKKKRWRGEMDCFLVAPMTVVVASK